MDHCGLPCTQAAGLAAWQQLRAGMGYAQHSRPPALTEGAQVEAELQAVSHKGPDLLQG